MASILAHGGVGGAVLESAIALGILFMFASVWIRERRARRKEGDKHDDGVTNDQLFREERESGKDD